VRACECICANEYFGWELLGMKELGWSGWLSFQSQLTLLSNEILGKLSHLSVYASASIKYSLNFWIYYLKYYFFKRNRAWKGSSSSQKV
jgi:hypothetical protein